MMTRMIRGALVLLLGGVVLSGAVRAQETAEASAPEPIEAQAIALVEAAMATLAAQEKLSVNWFVSFDEVVDGREKLTQLRSGSAVLSRGEGYYAFAEQDDRTRAYYFDRVTLAVHLIEKNAFVQVPFGGSFDALARRVAAEHGAALPIWQVLVTDAGDEILAGVTQAAYVGKVRIAGQVAHHVALSTYDEDLQLWISDDAEAPVPLMIVGTDPYSQGWPQYRAYFTDWDFAPEIEEGLFTFVPDEDATPMVWVKDDTADGEGR